MLSVANDLITNQQVGSDGYPELGPNQVVIFTIDLQTWRAENKSYKPLIEMLDDVEYRRYANFKFEPSKVTFLAGRTQLKQMLAHYLGVGIEHINFRYNEFGKPELNKPWKIAFNVSHSGDKLVIGISRSHNLGIDIEQVKPSRDILSIAKSFFANNEYALLEKLPEKDQILAFYKLWSLKESYIKAKSQGLAIDLCDFEFAFESIHQSIHLDFSNKLGDDPSHWHFHSIFIENNSYALSLASEHTEQAPEIHFLNLN